MFYIIVLLGFNRNIAMNNCPHCGAPIKEKYKICSACGTILITLSTEVAAHINLLRKKIENEPKDIKLHIELGSLYQKYDFLNEALDEYQKVISIDANNFDAYSKSAIIYLKLKDLSKAESAFRSALHINPHSEETLIGLFRVYYLQNKTIEAIALGEKIVKSRPNNVEFHMLLKNLYKQKGDKEKVFMELQKLESLIPNNEQVIKEIVQYFTDQNDMEGLIKYYQKMQEMNIEDIKLGFAIGKYYYDSGEYNKAIEHLNGMLIKENLAAETDTMIHIYLALAHFAKGDITSAASSVIRISPEQTTNIDGETRNKLASLFFEIGKNDLQNKKSKEAISFFEKAVSYQPDAAEYQQILDKTKTDAAISNKNFLRKILFISIGAIAVCIIIALMWHLSHNKIVIYVEPATEITILIDGKRMELQSKKSGVFESPKIFISSHTVVIEKEGYNKWQDRVNIGFGKDAVIRANLIPLYGTFRVNSEPDSANVYLDGEIVGKTPYVSGNIPALSHKINIELLGYQSYTRNITITQGDTVDLGTVSLKNLVGTWVGQIGEPGVAYNASFEMTIKQKAGQFTVKYRHHPSGELTYNGDINGIVLKNDFLADGNVNCRWRNVFYWENTKRRVIIKGKLSDNWERIEGKHYAEGLGEHDWWAVRKK